MSLDSGDYKESLGRDFEFSWFFDKGFGCPLLGFARGCIIIPLPSKEIVSVDGVQRAELVKQLHEKARANMKRKTKYFTKQANKGRKHVVFEPGKWVWLHLRKERFPQKRKSKLMPRGDGPFQVLERIGEYAYKLDLPGEYGVSATFNGSDLTPFDADKNLRTSSLQEREDDGGQPKELPPSTRWDEPLQLKKWVVVLLTLAIAST